MKLNSQCFDEKFMKFEKKKKKKTKKVQFLQCMDLGRGWGGGVDSGFKGLEALECEL